jgi:hypothetical protein
LGASEEPIGQKNPDLLAFIEILKTTAEQNKKVVLQAFDALFNNRRL